MQKWCPEPLSAESASGGTFVSLTMPTGSADASMHAAVGFRPEAGFASTEGLLAALSRKERAEIMELIEADLRREFDERHEKDRVAHEQAAQQLIKECDEARDRWQAEFGEQVRREVEGALRMVARQTVELGALIAEKIVRRTVNVDREVLVRAIETALFKVEAGCQLQVTVHPEDAEWLRRHPEHCQRLRISDIKEDRRLELGGALVTAEGHEWDATVERQLAVLAETLSDALAIPAGEEASLAEDPVVAPLAPDDETPPAEVPDA